MVLKIGLMDYSTKIPIRLLLFILFVPALLWGYGKAIVRMAQINNVDLQTDRSDNTGSNRGTDDEPLQAAINEKRVSENQVANQLNPYLADVDVAAADDTTTSQTTDSLQIDQPKKSVADTRLAKRPITPLSSSPIEPAHSDASPKGAKSAAILNTNLAEPSGAELLDTDGISENLAERSAPDIEPAGQTQTYTNRVLKPIIPAASPITVTDSNLNIKQTNQNAQPSFVGVLGIPTILFAGLFVVMWGIISGRIQRIMF